MPTRIVVKGKEYYRATWTESGKRFMRRFRTMEEAESCERAMRTTGADSFQPTGLMAPSLRNLFAAYLQAMANKGLGSQSITEKRTTFKSFALAFGIDSRAESIGYADCEAFLGRVAQNKTRSRANRYRVHLVAAWRWGVRAFRLPSECPWSVERFKENKRPRHVPSAEDFWAVYDVADEWDRRILLTYLHTAARKSELLNLTWEDVDLVKGTLRLFTAKRSGGVESDTIPMTSDVREAIEAQKRALRSGRVVGIVPDRLVFVSAAHGKTRGYFDRIMPDLCRVAGVKPFGFHGIRHLSASILASSEIPAWQVQRILRHRSITTTQIYVHELNGVSVNLESAFGGNVNKNEAPGSRTSRGL